MHEKVLDRCIEGKIPRITSYFTMFLLRNSEFEAKRGFEVESQNFFQRSIVYTKASIIQWQNATFPSLLPGFDFQLMHLLFKGRSQH